MPRQPDALIRTEAGSSYPVTVRCAHSPAFASDKCPPALRLTDSTRLISSRSEPLFLVAG
ncbi:hypothetical protein C7U60_01755 [Mesorhizobium plurifarium]|nr:hypothetical protein C7U60_01755 [Mesorhizobium plurifarium]